MWYMSYDTAFSFDLETHNVCRIGIGSVFSPRQIIYEEECMSSVALHRGFEVFLSEEQHKQHKKQRFMPNRHDFFASDTQGLC